MCNAGQLLRARLALLALATVWAAVSSGSAAGEQPLSIHGTLTNDAALADVFFLDRESGWAVGERGVTRHTKDGGDHWQQQASTVTCRLSSVCFVDSRRGWAVGGASQTYAGSTRGVVLRTEDGGATWAAVPDLVLPALVRVKFFDTQNGVAIADGASFAPSGVFATQDGGLTWKALSTTASGGWRTGDFLNRDAGAVAGAGGRFATVIEREVKQSPLASASLRGMNALRLVAPAGGWLVGDGGLVMTTRDLGYSWQSPAGELPPYLADHFDLRAVAVRGAKVWIGGSPGTRVFHSPDDGQTWQAFATGSHAPLRAIVFVDDQRGWAVGELGTILQTEDGGRTWKVQRDGGKRVALLTIVARGRDVPLEVLAEQGVEEGYLPAVETLFAAPAVPSDAADGAATARTREAAVLAGATACDTAWRFPLPGETAFVTPPEVIAALNTATDGQALERLESHLVRGLRTWRPDVVVTEHAVTAKGDPAAALAEQLVLRAVAAAADENQHVELRSQVGLDAWQVKRVYGLLPAGVHGDEMVATARFAPRLGGTLADWTRPARRLFDAGAAMPPDAYGLVLLEDRVEQTNRGRGLFTGIVLSPGGEARRPLATQPVEDVDHLRRSATRRRHLRELLERTEGNAAWAGQIANLLEGMEADAGGELLDQLAGGYRDSGRLDMAADTYYLLARRYPDHALADRALVWLVQYYASTEAAHRASIGRPPEVRPVTMTTDEDVNPVEQADVHRDLPQVEARSPGLSRDEGLRRAVQLGEYLEAARPALFAEPSVRFPIVAAQRQLGLANPAKRYFLSLHERPADDPWRRCGAAEEWLAAPDGLPPEKKLGACRPAGQRPHLDGRFDEPFWKTADNLLLTGEVDDQAVVRLAYDNEFLYIAIECSKLPSVRYESDDRPRPRDADVSQHDRVSLHFDIDRDYTTCFEFTVDQRGWTREAVWGDASWNPTWYVAATREDGRWTVEAAIPHAALSTAPPSAKHVWAVAACRTVPRVGNASWAGKAQSGHSPDQYGLLIFE